MPPSSIERFDVAEPAEILYASSTSRVFRPGGGAAARVVCKEYLGADAAQRLRNEKNLLARLAGIEGLSQLADAAHGANILTLRDCDAVTLAQVLQEGKCDTSTVLSLATQLARVLAEVHRAGVIHRDINPANILLSAARRVVLIDFDLGVLAEHHLAPVPDGQIVGTLKYLAPEQTGRTGRAVDQRADLYALGATLYEMAAGCPPFEDGDTLQLIHHQLVREPVSPSEVDAGVPRALSGIILRLLAKAPEQRYQSAEGLLHDLQRLRAELEQGLGGDFPLGERDFPARLAAPARLIGRDAELALLRTALADAMHTPRRTVLIDGAAGVGKSALIRQVRPEVAAAGGWFVHGKFDQYQKDGATAGALTQALRSLGRLLLAQSGDELAAQRRRILEVLGANAVLCTWLPEFALLLGKQPEIPEIDPRQAELQVQLVMADLLGAIAAPERPLVMVLDDLQWAGAASLRAFERLMTDPGIRGLLLVGAYRSDELAQDHLLSPLLAQWRLQPYPPMQMGLANLTLPAMGELTAEMLRLVPEPARELAEAVNALTRGNPFDTVEMIDALRRDGVLHLGESGWQWEVAKVRRFIGRGNVVDLLAARIHRLPAASRELLEFMACLGNAVECDLLGAAVGLDGDELRARLAAPLEDGLLIPDFSSGQDNSVHFRHDRVQQAVLAGMDESQRGRRQLDMARRLAAEPAFEADAAQQYLACADKLTQPGEQRRAAQLFHSLAQRLAVSANDLLAERYLASASALLAAIGDPGDMALRRIIDTARHRVLYSLGWVDACDSLFAVMQAHTTDALALVDPTCLQMRSLDMRGHMDAAIALGLRSLTQLGLDVPADFRDEGREQRLDALEEWVARDSQLDHSTRAQLRDPRLLGIAKVLNRMVQSAYLRPDMNAFAWLLLEGQRLWATHGPCAELVACMAHVISMMTFLRQDFRSGFNVVRHVLTVGESLGYEPQTSEARYRFAAYACAWFEPFESALDHAKRAYEGLRTGGDISIACTAHNHVDVILLAIAPTIDIADAEIEAGLLLCQRTGNIHFAALHVLEQRTVRALAGRTIAPDSFDDELFSEKEFLARMGGLSYIGTTFNYGRALQALLWGDVTSLARHTAALLSGLKGAAGSTYSMIHVHLFAALAEAWRMRQGNAAIGESPPSMAQLDSSRDWIAARAEGQPYNFLHLLLLVEAERAWALGDFWKAASTFDSAVIEAETRKRPWHRAFILERAGLFHLARELTGSGRDLLARARDQYQAWGAKAKVDQMEGEHVFLRAPARSLVSQAGHTSGHSNKNSNSVSTEALDLVGVLRASQALSSEITLEQLTVRVTDVLASLSGATKVLTLSCTEGQWWLHSPSPGRPSMPVAQAAELGLLPLSAFAYAERTSETLIVDDAPDDDRFARDPYFAGVSVCSLLVVPIAGQGVARAMLLLENRLGPAAFNAQRLDAVMLIAGQLAVSLANAQLYESLEQRVQARTRELQETQAQLVTTARRAGMAEIANNVLHNVGNVLNSINVSASVLRGTIGNSRIEGLTRAVELMNEHKHDLQRFMETDPRGKALWPYLNQVVSALQSERQEALNDLDRLSRSVDHITYVVSTQQAHAGPSSVLEITRPQELVEEALHLSTEVIERCGVDVVRRYEEVPATALDKQRLVQILINLIGNATQAMEGVPAHTRQLTLATGLARGEDGERLRITVQDRGEGIAAENLTRIFSHGFTTRKGGHGFGLHSCALAATEMGGKLTVRSDGPGHGAIFAIDLPLRG